MRRRSFIVRSAARMTLAATAVKIGYVPVNGDRRLAFESVADDIAELAKLFGIENAEVVGYSLGAAVALRTTVGYANPTWSENWCSSRLSSSVTVGILRSLPEWRK